MTTDALLLDSHVWVWTVSGEPRVGPKAKAAIRAAAERSAVAVSGISFWELAVKARKGKLDLLPDSREWLKNAARVAGIGIIDVDRELMLRAAALEWSHGDPADRLLVATALYHNLRLVTADRAILAHARDRRGLSVVDASQ